MKFDLSSQNFILSNASLAAYVHVGDVFFAVGGPETSGRSMAASAMQATAEELEKIGFIVKDRREGEDVGRALGY